MLGDTLRLDGLIRLRRERVRQAGAGLLPDGAVLGGAPDRRRDGVSRPKPHVRLLAVSATSRSSMRIAAGSAPGRYLVAFQETGQRDARSRGIGHRHERRRARPERSCLPSGLHRGEIVVRDAAGNEARGIFRFVAAAATRSSRSRGGSPPARRGSRSMRSIPTEEPFRRDSARLPTGERPGASSRSSVVRLARRGGRARSRARSIDASSGTARERRLERFFAFPDPRAERDSVFCDARSRASRRGALSEDPDRSGARVDSLRAPLRRAARRFARRLPDRPAGVYRLRAGRAPRERREYIHDTRQRSPRISARARPRLPDLHVRSGSFRVVRRRRRPHDPAQGSLRARHGRAPGARGAGSGEEIARARAGDRALLSRFSDRGIRASAPVRFRFGARRGPVSLERKGGVAVRRGARSGGGHGRGRKAGRLRGIHRCEGAGHEAPRVHPPDRGERLLQDGSSTTFPFTTEDPASTPNRRRRS